MGKKKAVAAPSKKTYGQKVLLVNRSNEDQFCAYTGRKLPRKGMVVSYEGKLYADWGASEAVANLDR